MAMSPGPDASTTPVRAGPAWQRAVLVLLGVYGAYLALVTPAGGPSIMTSTIVLVLAVAFSLSARGNRRHKQVVFTVLTVLLMLGLVSRAWA
jgi:hypothetical protein